MVSLVQNSKNAQLICYFCPSRYIYIYIFIKCIHYKKCQINAESTKAGTE